MKDLETYLRDTLTAAGCIDHALRASVDGEGRVTFYIHPLGADGDTLDFTVRGNTLEALR